MSASTTNKRCSLNRCAPCNSGSIRLHLISQGSISPRASHPSDETGGDYFDFIDAPIGVLYVAVGDVSGHGFDAALIMALTRAYMRSFATLGMDVGEVLGRVNRSIVGDLEANRYVTMLLVRIDVESGAVTYASAGHIPGVLLDGLDGIDCTLDSTGMPLGLFADATFVTRQCRFGPQQILVLGTDGATETLDSHGAEFGRNGVIHYVRTHEVTPRTTSRPAYTVRRGPLLVRCPNRTTSPQSSSRSRPQRPTSNRQRCLSGPQPHKGRVQRSCVRCVIELRARTAVPGVATAWAHQRTHPREVTCE